ncbi:hypothetical protein [Microvirga sp. VF16]|uniref:hypothetical protein n=1 Tax=Microvirga sp. VF16 TaxID=2807101 RepID=UPI00193D8F2B|nr:hypothetical protein [Microvirga sp. VF16]QRM29054.1 hypothetical protein JO965_23185 [Microvirga sp. VF16]
MDDIAERVARAIAGHRGLGVLIWSANRPAISRATRWMERGQALEVAKAVKMPIIYLDSGIARTET